MPSESDLEVAKEIAFEYVMQYPDDEPASDETVMFEQLPIFQQQAILSNIADIIDSHRTPAERAAEELLAECRFAKTTIGLVFDPDNRKICPPVWEEVYDRLDAIIAKATKKEVESFNCPVCGSNKRQHTCDESQYIGSTDLIPQDCAEKEESENG
jgi:hypothetical protein